MLERALQPGFIRVVRKAGWNIMKKSAVIGACLVVALGAFVAGRFSIGHSPNGTSASRHLLYYVDPMHPAYRSDKPGIAPDCGMPLVPVYEGEDQGAKLQLPPGAVYVDPAKQRLIGVRVQTVEKSSGPRMIRTTGRVEADQNRIHRMMAGADGAWKSVTFSCSVVSLENHVTFERGI